MFAGDVNNDKYADIIFGTFGETFQYVNCMRCWPAFHRSTNRIQTRDAIHTQVLERLGNRR
jgi:hypothetical protein